MPNHRDALTRRIKKIKSPISWDITKKLLCDFIPTLTTPGLDTMLYQLLDELVSPIDCFDAESRQSIIQGFDDKNDEPISPITRFDPKAREAKIRGFLDKNQGIKKLFWQIDKIIAFIARNNEKLPPNIICLLKKLQNHYTNLFLALSAKDGTTDTRGTHLTINSEISLITLVMQDGTHLSISYETAMAIMGLNKAQETNEPNAGNHPVVGLNGIHLKASSPRFPIQPMKEQAAASLIQLWCELLIVAPSMLVKLMGSVSGNIPSSSQAEPVLHQHLIQASYTIDGVNLLDVMILQHVFNKLKITLNDETLAKFIGDAINFSKNHADIEAPIEYETLLYEYQHRFIDLDENLFQEIYGKFGHNYLAKAFNLLKIHSFIGDVLDFEEAVYCLYLFETIVVKLFPHKHIPIIIEQIPILLELLNSEATSALFLGLLFSLPEDARFINIIFVVDERGSDGKIIQAHLVVFDNDESLRIPISLSRSSINVINIYMKNALFFIESLMNKTIDPKTVTRFMSKKPIEWMLIWLLKLGHQQQEIDELMQKKIITPSDITNGVGNNPLLLPLKIQSGVLTYIYQLMLNLHSYFRINKSPRLADIFSQALPIISAHHNYIANEKQRLTQEPMDVFSIQAVLRSSLCFTIIGGARPAKPTTWQEFLDLSHYWTDLPEVVTEFSTASVILNTLNATKPEPLPLAISQFMASIGFVDTHQDESTLALFYELQTLLPGIISRTLDAKPLMPVASSSSPPTIGHRPRSHATLHSNHSTLKFNSTPAMSIPEASSTPGPRAFSSQSVLHKGTGFMVRRHRQHAQSFIAPPSQHLSTSSAEHSPSYEPTPAVDIDGYFPGLR